jgi:phospholipid/cholesterol/gamma-HCH transport system substrate-binding protein
VKISGSGILGGKNLEIELGYSPEPAPSGDTLQSVTSGGLTEMMGSAQEQLENLINNTNRFLMNLNSVIDTTNRRNLAASLENINRLSAELNSLTVETRQLLAQNKHLLHRTLRNLDQSSAELNKFSSQLAQSHVDQLVQNLTESSVRLNKILKNLEQGKGSMGKLMTDEQLYRELNRTLQSLDALLRDLKAHPKRYVHFSVFGKKEKKN